MFHVKLSKKDKPFMGAYLFDSVLFCLKQGLWNENGMKEKLFQIIIFIDNVKFCFRYVAEGGFRFS